MNETPKYTVAYLLEGEALTLSDDLDHQAIYNIVHGLRIEAADLGIKIQMRGDREVMRCKQKWAKPGENRRQVKHRVQKYGMTEAHLRDRHVACGGKCEICEKPMGVNVMHIDHCHRTGKVRGLLCVSCNTALGKFGDCIEGLRRAAMYLKRFEDSLKEPRADER